MPTFTANLHRQGSGFVLAHYLAVPEGLAQEMLRAGHRRLLVTINGRTMRRGLIASTEVGETVVLGQEAQKFFGVKPGQTFEITLTSDPEPENLEIPEELTEWLEYDEDANREWLLLPPGVRRSIAYYIRTGKKTETRLARIQEMMRRIKAGELETQKAARRRAVKNG